MQAGPKLRIGALVIDVCSVKEQPVRWMKSLLPKDVLILGTHPLFGPDSAAKSLMGHTIVLCPVRIRKRQLQRLSTYLRARGLNVQLLTPLRHDKLMASTLFLTQFVGHGLRKLSLPNPTSSTHNFRSLHHIATITGNDTMELFRDMFEYNRFAKRLPEELLRSFSELHKTLKSPRSY
ncbi:MAG: prephenate dehydrogenase/arogenate dehydrogenase family protein [Ignavibacteriae bacterium]|nr:prephenate dehydrogenase/arogenate dehydrogenase family protein [Ignavibacteriota bacterium]